MKTKLELSGLGNLKWRNGKRQIPVKIFFFQKRATDSYTQKQFYNHIGNEDNRGLFTD